MDRIEFNIYKRNEKQKKIFSFKFNFNNKLNTFWVQFILYDNKFVNNVSSQSSSIINSK